MAPITRTMDDLHAFVERSRSLVDETPTMSERNTQMRLVQPLLSTLGWDVHLPEVEAEYPVGEDHVDFALLVEDDPAVFVDTIACGDPVTPEAGEQLTGKLATAGVDWGLLTNGETYVLLGREGDEFEAMRCALGDLPDHRDSLALYSREAAHERAAARRNGRQRAAERLTDERERVVEEVSSVLVEVCGDTVADDIDRATERFVDDLVERFGGDRPEASADAGDPEPESDRSRAGESTSEEQSSGSVDPTGRPDGSATGDAAPDGRSAVGDTTSGDEAGSAPDEPTEATDADGPATLRRRATEDLPERDGDATSSEVEVVETVASAPPGEYVVRFFKDSARVSAVGHGRPDTAAAQAIEYMMDTHSLSNRLSLPWGPDDEPIAVLNYEPVHRDGREMSAARELSNGYFLFTGLTVDQTQQVLERLAWRSGLEVLFQGDWEE